ncbi:MAG: hypothetical protein GX562_03630 [Coriobacteriaceae bacterium]|nr:hypothetical protein [Coriobacteriaceae bacterium]
MLQSDYLMRMIHELVAVVQRALRNRRSDPEATVQSLGIAIGNAVDIDADLFFSLEPESMVSMLRLGSFDEQLCGYIVRSMLLRATLLRQSKQVESARLAASQAQAIAAAYGCEITESEMTEESLKDYFGSSAV